MSTRRTRKSGNEVLFVHKDGIDRPVQILQHRTDGTAYVHYVGADKRLDEWLPASKICRVSGPSTAAFPPGTAASAATPTARTAGPHANMSTDASSSTPSTKSASKRKREAGQDESLPMPRRSPRARQTDATITPSSGTQPTVRKAMAGARSGGSPEPEGLPAMTEEEFDIHHHKQITAQRNFDKVNFGKWQIRTWYFSPYPLTESEIEDGVHASPSASASPAPALKIPGVQRATIRSHGRTSDLLAGGLTRSHLAGDRSVLWVCERCFKYMAEGSTWEMHAKKCERRHPPGRKVYQRGAHTIWEVDGASEKLYCQNLSLFGKLFIDVKTLFFDCDNFLFYILTDADSQRDHVLGFFSKEKYSYDDYNLACIVVLPPYQRKGYGMLMIEFSYELSRRAGKAGTPERPLSDLGLRSYLTYWVATVVRFLRRLLSVLPPDCAKMSADGWPTHTELFAQVQVHASTPTQPHILEESAANRKKRLKGWDGEVVTPDAFVMTPRDNNAYDLFSPLRKTETRANADGSATSHVVVRCTLADIARATNLRVEDAAFALSECGLLQRVEALCSTVSAGSGAGGRGLVVVVTREMVEAVARERKVREMCLSLAHVLL